LKQSPEDLAFARIDSIKRVPRSTRAFHFDNHDRLPIRCQHDEVCFIARITRTPPVPRERAILERPKKALCGAFSIVTADPMARYPRDEWLKPKSQQAEAEDARDPDSIGGEVISQGAQRSTDRSALVVKRFVVADAVKATAWSARSRRVRIIEKNCWLHLSSLFMESPLAISPRTRPRVVLYDSSARSRRTCE
jgi:hypothetical protein